MEREDDINILASSKEKYFFSFFLAGTVTKPVPAELASYISKEDWDNFCKKFNKTMVKYRTLGCAIYGMLVVTLFASIAGLIFVSPFLICLPFVALTVAFIYNQTSMRPRAEADVERICKEASDLHSSTLSFEIEDIHRIYINYGDGRLSWLKYTKYFIKITIKDPTPAPERARFSSSGKDGSGVVTENTAENTAEEEWDV